MSTRLLSTADLLIGSFYGGAERGTCIDFHIVNMEKTSAVLTEEAVRELASVLNAWLDRRHPDYVDRMGKLKQSIDSHKPTIIDAPLDQPRFISITAGTSSDADSLNQHTLYALDDAGTIWERDFSMQRGYYWKVTEGERVSS